MRFVRWVIELSEESGRAPSEKRTADIVDRLAVKIGALFTDGVRAEVRPLVCSVTGEELDELRERAAELAKSRGEEFSHEDWQFGGYVAVDVFVKDLEAFQATIFAKRVLVDAIRAAEFELRQGPWVESIRQRAEIPYEDEPLGAKIADPRLARDLLFPAGTKHPLLAQALSASAVGLTVIERSWWLKHTEIDPERVCAITPSGSGTGGHGLATLGVLVGRHGGIVPWLPSVGLLSPHDRCGGTEINWTDAVLAAAVGLAAGGVILIEQQDEVEIPGFGRYNLPPEVYPGVAKAIALASAAGITIVEPAGNGGAWGAVDFNNRLVRDAFLTGNFLWPTDSDSGAVLVGAVAPTDEKCSFDVVVNIGSRIDIKAPGNCYRVPGWYPRKRPKNPETSWSPEYGLTSGASAIVAGVFVLIQTLRSTQSLEPLTPTDLRKVVRDLAAASQDKPGCGMGVLGAPSVDDFVAVALAIAKP